MTTMQAAIHPRKRFLSEGGGGRGVFFAVLADVKPEWGLYWARGIYWARDPCWAAGCDVGRRRLVSECFGFSSSEDNRIVRRKRMWLVAGVSGVFLFRW